MSKTKDLFQEIEDSNDGFNHIAMDGGHFMIEKHEVIEKLLKCRENDVFSVGLVPVIRFEEKCIFFLDVDYLDENQTIEDVMSVCLKVLREGYKDNLLTNRYITKSKSKNRYHVYLPQIILTKQTLTLLWFYINDSFENKPIDASPFGLRYDGFFKFDTKITQKFAPNTEYVPYKNQFTLDKKFYSDTYLFADNDAKVSEIDFKFHFELSWNYSEIQKDFEGNYHKVFIEKGVEKFKKEKEQKQ